MQIISKTRFSVFSPSVNYNVNIANGTPTAVSVAGKVRPAWLGSKGGKLLWGNNTGIYLVQYNGLNRSSADIETTYPTGEATHYEETSDGLRVAFNPGETLTASACRCQILFYPQPLGPFIVDIQVKFGDDVDPWELTAAFASPATIWQIKPTSGNAPLSLIVDTDDLNASKLSLKIDYRSTIAASGVRLGIARNLERNVWHRIILSGDFQYDNTGWLRYWINGQTIFENRNFNTLSSDAATLAQMFCGLYMYNNTAPDTSTAPKRVIYFRNFQNMVQSPFAQARR